MTKEQLPPFVLAELYPNSLVIIENILPVEPALVTTSVVSPETIAGPKFFGSNAKQLTILVEEPDAVFLSEDNLSFLSTVLGACKLNIGDVAIFNIAQTAIGFEEIKKMTSPQTCLLFGIETNKVALPFRIPAYQQQAYAGCNFLLVPGFEKYVATNPDAKLEKTKLWVSLKKLLNV